MDLGLNGRVVIVTGGASGIGAAITRTCMAEGATVVAVGRGSEQVDVLRAESDRFEFMTAELGDPAVCDRAVAAVQARHGRLDGLVNNAGTNDRLGLESGTPAAFLLSLRENLLHCYAMAHFALPLLKEARGAIVNISSKVALTGQGGTSAYAAAKGAQLALTREWAVELAPSGVRVNCVLPAEVMTPQYRRQLDDMDDPEAELTAITRRIPLGHRMTKAEEIAAMVAFLLSPRQAAHITGQQIVVDGGYTHLDRAMG